MTANQLLKDFDRRVLGGYSPVTAQQVNPLDLVVLEGGEGRPIYQELLAQLSSLSGMGREEFLYRLRRTWLKAQDLADMLKDRARRWVELTDVSLCTNSERFLVGGTSERLPGVLSAYRDLEKVVAYVVNQARTK